MKEHQTEQMRKILEIVDTGIEAMEYIVKGIQEGKDDPCLYLISDVIDGYLMINGAVEELEDEMDLSNLRKIMPSIEIKLLTTVDLINVGNVGEAVKFIEGGLINEVKYFREECGKLFAQHVTC